MKLIAHLSRRFPAEEHQPFYLDHRLFSDTTSQLPGSDVKQRTFTHIFSFSHDSKNAFVRTTKIGDPEGGSSVTIPISSTDAFTSLLITKMQPLWYPRQMLNLENGVSVSLRNNGWRICIGDARTSARSQGAGILRGTVIELCKTIDSPEDDEPLTPEEVKEFQETFQDVLEQIFKGVVESFSGAKFVLSKTLPITQTVEGPKELKPDWNLAEIYMTVLRGQR